jgi:hypothetical protein
MPTITCTPGGPTDNSYVTEAQADAYFADTLRQAKWFDFDDFVRQAAVIQATREIEAQGGSAPETYSPRRSKFEGVPFVDTQSLHFPRPGDNTIAGALVIPEPIRAAVCEQAFWLADREVNGGDLVDRQALQAEGVKSFSVDGLSESFGSSGVPLGIAPAAWEKLRPYVKRGSRIV